MFIRPSSLLSSVEVRAGQASRMSLCLRTGDFPVPHGLPGLCCSHPAWHLHKPLMCHLVLQLYQLSKSESKKSMYSGFGGHVAKRHAGSMLMANSSHDNVRNARIASDWTARVGRSSVIRRFPENDTCAASWGYHHDFLIKGHSWLLGFSTNTAIKLRQEQFSLTSAQSLFGYISLVADNG